MTSISVLIIALNEEDHIASCLESVTWAEEVIVVDAGSTDRTAQIASRMGAKVLCHPWEGYAPQRRFALEKAHNEWILVLDADEIVSEKLRKEIQERVGKESVSGYTLLRLNHFIGKPVMHCGWYPDRIKRCFRKSAVSVPDAHVHEGHDILGEIGELNGYLMHYSYNSLHEYFDKMNRYTSLEVKDRVRKSGTEVRWYDLVFRPLSRFLRMYLSRKGYRDGLTGFMVSAVSSIYLLVLYAKLWERWRSVHSSARSFSFPDDRQDNDCCQDTGDKG